MEPQEKIQLEHRTGSSIQLAIDLDAAFKIYSYRIIDHATYVARTMELVQTYQKALKEAENLGSQGQPDEEEKEPELKKV